MIDLTLTENFMFNYEFPLSIISGATSGFYATGSVTGAFYGAVIGGFSGWFAREAYLDGVKAVPITEKLHSDLKRGSVYDRNSNEILISRRSLFDYLNPEVEAAF